jgi:hypothetical protein
VFFNMPKMPPSTFFPILSINIPSFATFYTVTPSINP